MGKVIHINDLIHYVEDVGSGPRAICRSGDGHVIREGRITKYICKVTCEDCLKALNINTDESEPKSKVTFVCSHCKSESVKADAYAEWNVEEQKWEVSSTFDKGAYCYDCDGPTRLDKKVI